MSLTRCPQCQHGNPAGSKFCSACGVALDLPPHLASCPRCGTVNPVKATVCCWCGGQLSGRRSLSRRPSRVIVGTVVLAAIAAVLGYYTYRQRSLANAPQPPAASSEASGRGAPAAAGFLDREAEAGDTKSANADNSAGFTSPTTSPSGVPAKPAAITRPRAISADRASERGQSRPESCTEAVAALGLCATKPVQQKAVTDAGKAGGQEPRRTQACTEALTALGLCTPNTTQRRE